MTRVSGEVSSSPQQDDSGHDLRAPEHGPAWEIALFDAFVQIALVTLLALADAPRVPATVEKRVKSSVFFPTWEKILALA
jgi:hypothetical protein